MTDKVLGPTGEFPHGKINPMDEGALRIAVGTDESGTKVVVDFSGPVAWLGMTAEEAVEVAEALLKHARTVAKRQGKLLTVNL